MKGKILFRGSLLVLRVARAFAFLGLLLILVAIVLELLGSDSIYIDKWSGSIKFSISKNIAFTSPTLKIPGILHLENRDQLYQVSKAISKNAIISTSFNTGIAVVNPTNYQMFCIVIYNILFGFAYFFFLHFMIKIMKNVLKNELISVNNNSYLKIIASVVAVTPIVLYLLEVLYLNSFSFASSKGQWINGFGVSIKIEPKFEMLIFSAIGLFIYLLAKVQEYGLKLKQENDLTV